MIALRKHLSVIATFWVLFQIAGIAASFTPNRHATEQVCTCPDSDHATVCPMHHQQEATPDDQQRCRLQNAGAPLDVALLSLVAGAGILPPATTHIPPVRSAAAVVIGSTNRVSRAHSPDSPPPRA